MNGVVMKEKEIKFDYTYLLPENIGEEHGVSLEEVLAYQDAANDKHAAIMSDRETERIGFYNLPFHRKTVQKVKRYAADNYKRFENFVVLGIGGSALGNIALLTSLKHPFYNYLTGKERDGYPRIFILDNVDPELVAGFLDVINPKKTLFNVISKSGSTAETAAQFLIFAEQLRKKMGGKFHRNLVITTDPEKGDLRAIAEEYGIDSFDIPPNVGGRFSVLSSVGLLTAAFAGINVNTLLGGAADMLRRCQTPDLSKNPAYLNALFHYIMDRKRKKNISVMMSYSSPLYYWADWYRQLWAESLGKNKDLRGNAVNVGQTPVKALGVTDQHSQVQLYTEGPNDKVFTFLTVGKYRDDLKIPKFKGNYPSLGYLSGSRLSRLFDAEMQATEYALSQRARPSCRIVFPEINEYTVGQFIMLYELKTAFAGQLYNIDAFNQPGVEAGKVATYGLLGRDGYGAEAKKILEKEKDRSRI
jgi:glucose-6-phosphate isomerase